MLLVSISIYFMKEKSTELQPEEKQIITWLPCKLFHVSEANNEQENVVGESFLNVCKIK